MKLLPFFILFFTSAIGRADILMLDLNNSPEEYKAAKRAAEARGERLVRIPPVTAETEKEFQQANDQIWRAIVTKRKTCENYGTDSSECSGALKSIDDAKKDYSALVAKVPKVDKKMLDEAIGSFKERGAKMSSLVISGHDGDRDFGGIWGRDLTESDIAKLFKKHQPVGDDVRSLLLWGCYAATVDDFRDSWKAPFPYLNFIGGFDAMGPAGDRPSNGKFLGDLLKKEKRLSEAKTKKDLEKIANALDGIGDLYASFCVDRELIIQRRNGKLKAMTMDEAHAECAEPNQKEQELAEQFQCYLNADEGCANPPPNPKSNVIRQYYEVLQKNRHCKEIMAKRGVTRPHHASARRLLFDNTVRSSFNRLHSKEMAAFNRLLNELGVPSKYRIKNLGIMSRKDYLNLLRNLKREYTKMDKMAREEDGVNRDPRVLAVGLYLEQIHKIEDHKCVPLSWIEGHAPEEGRCGTKRAMATIPQRAEELSRR